MSLVSDLGQIYSLSLLIKYVLPLMFGIQCVHKLFFVDNEDKFWINCYNVDFESCIFYHVQAIPQYLPSCIKIWNKIVAKEESLKFRGFSYSTVCWVFSLKISCNKSWYLLKTGLAKN